MNAGSEPSNRNDLTYKLTDVEVDAISQRASVLFNNFTDNKDVKSLKNAISLMEQAIEKCLFANDDDLAYCYRRYASIIIRDESNPERYHLAQKALDYALNIYEFSAIHPDILQLESQRALHQMRKIAYELKDGELLEQVTDKFLPMAKKNSDTNFLSDCYESQFHLAFAKSDFTAAFAAIDKSAELEKDPVNANRHRIKVHLAILQTSTDTLEQKQTYLEKNIVKPFWLIYDKQKKILADNPDAHKHNLRMVKDLMLLCTICCQRSVLGMNDWGQKPASYVLNQAKTIFGSITDYYYLQLKKTINAKIAAIKEQGMLTLDYSFYENRVAPNIAIDLVTAEKLFAITVFQGTQFATREKIPHNSPRFSYFNKK